jgi:hypothetical protein
MHKKSSNKKKQAAIRNALAMATSSLLMNSVHAANTQGGSPHWEVDSSVLYYDEQDRVQVIKPVVSARKEISDERFLTVRALFDTMTGASPNGASPSSQPQTFTTPSGKDSYTVGANEYPMRDFNDTRVAGSVSLETPISRMVKATLGLNGSVESDYSSFGGSAILAKDINNRLTTLTGGLALSFDFITPDSSTPQGLSVMPAPASGSSAGEDEEGEERGEQKVVLDLLFGITQVINTHTLTQLNYGLGLSSGYLTDPYKILSRVDSTTGLPVDYLYEKRPDSRLRNSLYWHTAHQFDEDSIHFSYRYYWDDWGIKAHTADVKYRFELGGEHYLQPHLRYYQQGAADFYHHSLVDGEPTPRYASADLRLAEFTSSTIGIKYGMPLLGGDFSVRVEKMRQVGDSHPSDAIGDQKKHDLFPTLDASIIQLSYSFIF